MQAMPKQGKVLMRLARGVTLCELTKACERYVCTHLREGDRMEHELAREEVAPEDVFKGASCAVWHEGKLVALWQSVLLFGEGPLSTRRGWGFMTTHHVTPIWRTFVRMTKPVYEALWALEAPWVDTVFVAPWTGYEATLRWQARFLPQQEVKRFVLNGEEHILYKLERGDR